MIIRGSYNDGATDIHRGLLSGSPAIYGVIASMLSAIGRLRNDELLCRVAGVSASVTQPTPATQQFSQPTLRIGNNSLVYFGDCTDRYMHLIQCALHTDSMSVRRVNQ